MLILEGTRRLRQIIRRQENVIDSQLASVRDGCTRERFRVVDHSPTLLR